MIVNLKNQVPLEDKMTLYISPMRHARRRRMIDEMLSVIKFPKCCQCGWCYLYCPTGSIAITEHERFTIDLTYCKGCGICASVCPVDAIMMVEEV
ncbi:MAG: 4Fe-4S binding protein, partial [Thermodesulfobacteriota bacterium]|nr:4Fe-4S binding protein [Thermodesulfobacteriota bacterium]